MADDQEGYDATNYYGNEVQTKDYGQGTVATNYYGNQVQAQDYGQGTAANQNGPASIENDYGTGSGGQAAQQDNQHAEDTGGGAENEGNFFLAGLLSGEDNDGESSDPNDIEVGGANSNENVAVGNSETADDEGAKESKKKDKKNSKEDAKAKQKKWADDVDHRTSAGQFLVLKDTNVDEGLGTDYLKSQFKPPSMKKAKVYANSVKWKGGLAPLGVPLEQLSALGVGLMLYFKFLIYLSKFFFLLTVLSVPILYIYYESQTGMTEQDLDGLGFARISLGNHGFNPDEVFDTADCIANGGDIDCTGQELTYAVPGGGEITADADIVSYLITIWELVVVVAVVIFIPFVSARASKSVKDAYENDVLPTQYAIYVTGLPPDVDYKQITKHFNSLYSLDKPQPCFPVLGLNRLGALLLYTATLGLLFGLLAGIATSIFLGQVSTYLPGCTFGFMILVALFCVVAKVGRPITRLPTFGDEAEAAAEAEGELDDADLKKANISQLKHALDQRERVSNQKRKRRSLQNAEGWGDDDGAGAGGAGGAMAELGGGGGGGAGTQPGVAEGSVQDVSNTGSEFYKGKWIAEVAVVHTNSDIIDRAMKDASILTKLKQARAKAQKVYARRRAWESTKRKAVKKVEKLEKSLGSKHARIKKMQQKSNTHLTHAAFVVFNQAESFHRCMQDYKYSQGGLMRYFQPKALQFRHPASKKYYKLTVEQAPMPTEVLWHNLVVPWYSLLFRRLISTGITILLLVISIVAISQAQEQQRLANERVPETSLCTTDLPALMYGTYNFQTVYESDGATTNIERDRTKDDTCTGENEFYLFYGTEDGDGNIDPVLDPDALPDFLLPDDETAVPRSRFEQTKMADNSDFVPSSTGNYTLCDGPCFSTKADYMCHTLPCAVTDWTSGLNGGEQCQEYKLNTFVGCYCINKLKEAISVDGFVTGINNLLDEESDVCKDIAQTFLNSFILQFSASFVLVAVNTMLVEILRFLTKFERHHSATDEVRASTVRLFLAQFINTAFIVLLVNADAPDASAFHILGLLDGDYKTTTRGWFSSVGVSIAMTMFVQIWVPPIAQFVKIYVVTPMKRSYYKRSAVTQGKLNKICKGPRFQIEVRMSNVMMIFFVTLMYGSAMPCLFLFAAVNFALAFHVDKYFLLRHYREPPKFNANMIKLFVSLMPVALLLHFVFAIYILGSGDYMASDKLSDDYEAQITDNVGNGALATLMAQRLITYNTLPVVVAFVVYIAVTILHTLIAKGFLQGLKRIIKLEYTVKPTKGGNGDDDGGGSAESKPPYAGLYTRSMTVNENLYYNQYKRLPPNLRKQDWEVFDAETGLLYQAWSNNGKIENVKHRKGQPKRTWQVIQTTVGAYSYYIRRNDHYFDALAFLQADLHNFMDKMSKHENKDLKKMDRKGRKWRKKAAKDGKVVPTAGEDGGGELSPVDENGSGDVEGGVEEDGDYDEAYLDDDNDDLGGGIIGGEDNDIFGAGDGDGESPSPAPNVAGAGAGAGPMSPQGAAAAAAAAALAADGDEEKGDGDADGGKEEEGGGFDDISKNREGAGGGSGSGHGGGGAKYMS